MKDCSNSITTTPELLQSNAKPSIYPVIKILYTLIDVNPYIPMITGKIRVLLCLVVVGSALFDFTATHQGPYSKSREISKSRDWMFGWSHCFEIWVASWQLWLRCPSNVRAIAEVCSKSRRLRDFTRSCGKTSIHLVNRGPVGIHQWLCGIMRSSWKRPPSIPVPHICGSALVQIMACRLFGAEPLSKPVLGYCQLDP